MRSLAGSAAKSDSTTTKFICPVLHLLAIFIASLCVCVMPPRTASTTIIAASAATAVAVLIATKMFATKSFPTPAILESAEEHKQVLQVLKENLDDLSGDALTKIIRQLDFWVKEKLPESELVALTKRLVHAATWRKRMGEFQVPKVRFGRTEVQMPIITCGSMRFQFTWMSDKSPDVISKKNVVNTTSQENVLDIVRGCLRMGINHFETARNYGTSEIQLVHALSTLIKRGEIKRSDFILQTKTPVRTRESFKQFFEESWEHVKELGYIDLFSFWIITNENQVELALSDAEDGIMAMALEWKKKGMIKHIGFSTHGAATTILKVINSNKFDYINLHNHYFGDYHGEGTLTLKEATVIWLASSELWNWIWVSLTFLLWTREEGCTNHLVK